MLLDASHDHVTPPRAKPAAEADSPGLRDGSIISELLRPAASASDISRLAAPEDPLKFAEKPHPEAAAASARPTTVPEDADGEPCTSERVAFFDLDLTLLDINTGRSWRAPALPAAATAAVCSAPSSSH